MIGYALLVAVACLSAAILLNLFRLLRGPEPVDRILALDTMVINGIVLILLFGIQASGKTYFEAALLLSMVGFVGTVAFAKFLLRGDIVE